jgi:putative two-component system response regulator
MTQTASSGKERPTVLIIDDSQDVLSLVNDLLRPYYRLKAAIHPQRGIDLAAAAPRPDVILLDIVMPEFDGLEVCRRLKADPQTREIPIIFLTARNNEGDEREGFEAGAVDYIAKPISGPILLARVKNHIELKRAGDFMRSRNQFLAGEVAKRAREVDFVQDVTIFALASLAETRDNETGNHLRRTQHYVRALAEHLQHHPHFALTLTHANIEMIFKSAPLHDIGKVGIPDQILLKPGRLDAGEFAVMRGHAALGREAIEHAEQAMGRTAPFLAFAKDIAASHHEKWDGSGYPAGLAGEAIPIPARLMAVADVYDALISRRIYKPPLPHAEACAIIAAGRGSHFDPDVADAFLALEGEFAAIAQRFDDAEPLSDIPCGGTL